MEGELVACRRRWPCRVTNTTHDPFAQRAQRTNGSERYPLCLQNHACWCCGQVPDAAIDCALELPARWAASPPAAPATPSARFRHLRLLAKRAQLQRPQCASRRRSAPNSSPICEPPPPGGEEKSPWECVSPWAVVAPTVAHLTSPSPPPRDRRGGGSRSARSARPRRRSAPSPNHPPRARGRW